MSGDQPAHADELDAGRHRGEGVDAPRVRVDHLRALPVLEERDRQAQDAVAVAVVQPAGLEWSRSATPYITRHFGGWPDSPLPKAEDVRFDRSLRGEVDDVRLACLSDAMDASDTLLDHHGVPWQLVVHQHVAELEVESLGAGA